MNKKISALLGAILIIATGLMVSCKDYDDEISGLDDRVTDLEASVKTLQAQLEDAIANGCWIEYYDIDQATGNCTLHFLGREETLTIPSIQGKDAIIRHFKVYNGTWQYASADGVYSDVLNSLDNSPVKVTVDENGVQVLGNIGVQTVETPDNGEVQVICIGDVHTTIRCDKNDPILAVDEENKYLVVSVGGVHYTLLLEGSTFKGLQSVVYRKVYAFDDYLEIMSLVGDNGELLAASQPSVSFRVLPKDFKVEQALFSFADVRQLQTRAVAPQLIYKKNSASLSKGILSLAFDPQNIEDNKYYGATLCVTLNGFTTISDDFIVKKSQKKVKDAQVFVNDASGEKIEVTDESPLVFDEKKPFYLSNLNCGFEVGNNDNKAFVSLQNLGFAVKVTYKLDEEAEQNFTYGEDERGEYLAVKANSENKGNVTITYTLETGQELLEKTIPIMSKSLNILLGAEDESVNMSQISSLFKSSKYIKLSSKPLQEISSIDDLFGTQSEIALGYMKDGKVVVLNKEKVHIAKNNEEKTDGAGLYLFIDKQTDLDKLTNSSNKQVFDLYLLAENGSVLQVDIKENDASTIKKSLYLKGVNFFYQPYFRAKEEFQDYIIFDNGKVDNHIIDMAKFPKASIKGKAIIGRQIGDDAYSFNDISFAELYEWSPEDYVTFSIQKEDQTDFLQEEWGKSFIYKADEGTFTVNKPCNLRKLNFGKDQKAEKKDDVTIPNTDPSMKEKGGNEGLKIRYTEGNKSEVIDNWYFLDPISSPGDRWFYFHYRFNLAGADRVYCYDGSTAANTTIDILRCLTNTDGLSANDADKLNAFNSKMAWDWYFTDVTGSNSIVSVVKVDDENSKIVVSDAAKSKYGDIKVTFMGPGNNKDKFELLEGYEENFQLVNTSDFSNTQIKLKITTQFGEQEAMFNLKKH